MSVTDLQIDNPIDHLEQEMHQEIKGAEPRVLYEEEGKLITDELGIIHITGDDEPYSSRSLKNKTEDTVLEGVYSALGFSYERSEDRNTFYETFPSSEHYNALRKEHPDLFYFEWEEVEGDGDRQFKAEDIVRALAQRKMILSSTDRYNWLAYHDHQDHGMGNALVPPIMGSMIEEAAKKVVQTLDDESVDPNAARMQAIRLASAVDDLTGSEHIVRTGRIFKNGSLGELTNDFGVITGELIDGVLGEYSKQDLVKAYEDYFKELGETFPTES